MALSYTTLRAIPYLHDYAAAERWERDVKPIRGDAKLTKPLGKRDQKYRSIKRENDGAIAICCGFTRPTLRFYPDGTLAIYSTMSPCASTQEIITEVTGLKLYTQAGKTWVEHGGGESPLRKLNKYTDEVPNFFRRDERHKEWVCTNPPGLTTHTVNRKAAKAIRARYADAINYIMALSKLMAGSWPKHEEVVAAFHDEIPEADRKYWWKVREYIPPPATRRFQHNHAARFVALLESSEPGDHYKAFLWASSSGGDTNMRTALDRILMMYHHNEWFDEVEVPAGTKAIDRYEWAFPKHG